MRGNAVFELKVVHGKGNTNGGKLSISLQAYLIMFWPR